MDRLTADADAQGAIIGDGSTAAGGNEAGLTLVVRHSGDWRAAVLPWKVPGARVAVAETAFKVS